MGNMTDSCCSPNYFAKKEFHLIWAEDSTPVVPNVLLLEDGTELLLEDGTNILLE